MKMHYAGPIDVSLIYKKCIFYLQPLVQSKVAFAAAKSVKFHKSDVR